MCFLLEIKIKYLSDGKEKWLNREDHLCTLQSSYSPKSWQLHSLLIYRIPSLAFFFLSIPLPLHPYHKAVWQSSLFSFKRMNEDKKQSKMEHERHHFLWFMMAGSLALLCSPACFSGCLPVCLPARLAVCSFPGTLMESRSLLAVTPSSHQEWLIMVLNIDLCLTCVKIPPTL